MPPTRLIVTACPEPGSTARISREEAAHARARRLAPGDAVTLIDGSGAEARGRLVRWTTAGAEVVVDDVAMTPPPDVDLTVCVSALRLDRLCWIVEKATELSARRMLVVAAERAQAFRAGAARMARLSRVGEEAAKQCESARWPQVSGPIPLDDALGTPARHRLFLDLEGEAFPATLASGSVAVAVGPEGGWTPRERTAALARGWVPVRLAAGKLRAETAAIAAIVLAREAIERGRASH